MSTAAVQTDDSAIDERMPVPVKIFLNDSSEEATIKKYTQHPKPVLVDFDQLADLTLTPMPSDSKFPHFDQEPCKINQIKEILPETSLVMLEKHEGPLSAWVEQDSISENNS
jgi:hypothetical protein